MTTEDAKQKKEFPMTQAIMNTVGAIFVGLAEKIPEEFKTEYRTAMALIETAKTVGATEGMKPGDVVMSEDGSAGLQCKNKGKARFSQEEVYKLGEIGQTCIGLFKLAHEDDPEESQMAFTNKLSLEISLEEIAKFIEKMDRCRELAEAYKQSHPEPEPSPAGEE